MRARARRRRRRGTSRAASRAGSRRSPPRSRRGRRCASRSDTARRARRSRCARPRCAAGTRTRARRRRCTSRPSQPISSHAAGASGSVTIIELFIGTSARPRPVQLGGVALGRAHDPARAHAPGGGERLVRADRADGRGLVDAHAEALDGRGEAGEQLGGVNARDVRREARAARPGDAHALLELVGRQLAQVVLVEAVRAAVCDLCAQALQLRVAERDREVCRP